MLLHLREVLAPSGALAPWVVLIFAAIVFPSLFFIVAPYGRHFRPGWGPSVPARAAWAVMESPSLVLFALLWLGHPMLGAPVVTTLGLIWLVHYTQRTLVFPLLMRDRGKRKPVLVALMAIVFNVLNALGNGEALADRPLDAPFFAGVAIFFAGFVVNLWSDAVLRRLRGPEQTGYRIPRGGLYELISSPNYLGEILEWVGFALAAQTLAGWAFAAFTIANLAPRALAHHRWYASQFPDYPPGRRALVPFLW